MGLQKARIRREIIDRSRIGRCRIPSELFVEQLRESVHDTVISVHDKAPAGLAFKTCRPVHKAFPVCVSRDSLQGNDLRLHSDRLVEKLYFLHPVKKPAPESPFGLVADEQDRAFLPPQVMLQMMLDPACIAHAACGNDHLRLHIEIDRSGFICGGRKAESRERNRIDSFHHKLLCLVIKAVSRMLIENLRRFQGKRAVHIDLEAVMSFDHMRFLDLPDKIEHFLCASDCEGGDDNISAPVKCTLNDFRKLRRKIDPRSMAPISIGRFHHDIVRPGYLPRIPDERLILISDIAGEDDLDRLLSLCDPDFDRRGSQKMADVIESDFDPGAYLIDCIILHLDELPEDPLGVLCSIVRNVGLFALALSFAVPPLRFKLLNVSRVEQHDIAEIAGRRRRVDLSCESLHRQERKIPAVVNVRVREQHKINL